MTVQSSAAWLKAIGVLFIIIGAAFSWSTFGTMGAIGESLVDFVVWPTDGAQSYAAVETRLLVGIAGGLTAGLGAAVFMIAKHVYPQQPAVGRQIITVFMLIWFVVDGLGSIIAGGAYNALANLLFLIPVMLPLMLARPNEVAGPAMA